MGTERPYEGEIVDLFSVIQRAWHTGDLERQGGQEGQRRVFLEEETARANVWACAWV